MQLAFTFKQKEDESRLFATLLATYHYYQHYIVVVGHLLHNCILPEGLQLLPQELYALCSSRLMSDDFILLTTTSPQKYASWRLSLIEITTLPDDVNTLIILKVATKF